jgi:transposase-like protein
VGSDSLTPLDNQRSRARRCPAIPQQSEILAAAATLYATGLSLAAVAARYGIDPQTVANRSRRAGIPIRPRRGWPPQHTRT